ncbi:MAG TPA: M14 family zinc carboxypeptidase, partial [Bacteroidota bacterium]|nr:M14 family zinc carboxypeptidase [Bacteroidota bacterium]
MKYFLGVFILLFSLAPGAPADEPPGHGLVRIFVDDAARLRTIWSAGLDFEGASGKPGGWMEFVATPAEMRELAGRGIDFAIVEPDLAAASARGLVPSNALGFGTGSMGGYYTLDEIGMQLDSMKLLYPSLITDKQEIGYSVEGRPVWAAKISDNPDSDEPGEPEVLYTALTHAREPAGMMTVMYTMWWLLEQYASDPSAEYLVNNRQVWFIPVINVDGYAYNESTNPAGGGFWRKNRRDNGNGTWGIDLNRNYGPQFMWNAPNGGSSTNTGSDTYRGPIPFSEPETQTIDLFMRLHRIRTCLNYHTYSRLLIYPYGYLEAESEDSLIYREFAFDMVRSNRYATGTDQQTVNYSTRGNSDDYMYGDTTKFRTYAMTPEVGTSFWPPSGQILPLAMENLSANIHAAYVAGSMPLLATHTLSESTAADGFLPGKSFAFQVTIRNKGLDTSDNLAVAFSTDSGNFQFTAGSIPVHQLPPRSDTLLGVSGTVDASAMPGETVRLFVRITDPEGYDRTDTLTLFPGRPVEIFSDDAESGTALWSVEGSWDVSAVPHGGALSFHDSPAGASPSGSSAGIQTAAPVDLTGFSSAKLEFWTKWAIEPSYDFGIIKISTDGGGSWSILRTALSNNPSGSGVQTPGTFGYDAYTPGLDWVRQEIDLSAFTGVPISLRFELATDGADSRDGWYVDDVRITGYRETIPGGTVGVSAASLSESELHFGEWPGASDGIDPSLG